MNHHVVETGVEHGSLCFSTAFHFYGLQGGVPSLSCLLAAGFKVQASHFFLQVLTSILNAHETPTHAYFYLFSFFAVEVEPGTDVVSTDVLAVLGVDLVLACRVIPHSLCGHRAHLFPVAALFGDLVHSHHKVDGEYGLRIVAEGAL